MREILTLVRQTLNDVKAYQPGKTIAEVCREHDLNESEVVKLASNENPLGPPASVINWLKSLTPRKLAELISRYPEDHAPVVGEAISKKYHVPFESVIIGNGSVELIRDIAAIFIVGPRDEVIFSEHAFPYFDIESTFNAATKKVVPMRNGYWHDLKAMKKRITKQTKVIFVANPNNPTGTMNTREEVDEFLDDMPDHVIVVLDEAYAELVEEPDYPNSIEYLESVPRLVILHTLSKYGCAGVRFGYGLGTVDVCSMLWKRHLTFSINAFAQEIALRALADTEHIERTKAPLRKERAYVAEGYRELGLGFVPTVANFFLVHFPIKGTTVYQHLLEEGVIVRPILDLPMSCRISIGTRRENAKLLRALKKLKEKGILRGKLSTSQFPET